MKVKRNNIEFEYDYSFRRVRFYRPESYPEFSEICKKNYTSVTRELNIIIEHAIKNNLLLSDLIK